MRELIERLSDGAWNDISKMNTIVLGSYGLSIDAEVLKMTDKAIRVKNGVNGKATWVPRKALSFDKDHSYQGKADSVVAYKLAPWFVRKVSTQGKPYERVALGLSTF